MLGNYGGIPFTTANTNGLQQAVTATAPAGVSTNQTRADGQPTMYTTIAGATGQTAASGVPAEQLTSYLQVRTSYPNPTQNYSLFFRLVTVNFRI